MCLHRGSRPYILAPQHFKSCLENLPVESCILHISNHKGSRRGGWRGGGWLGARSNGWYFKVRRGAAESAQLARLVADPAGRPGTTYYYYWCGAATQQGTYLSSELTGNVAKTPRLDGLDGGNHHLRLLSHRSTIDFPPLFLRSSIHVRLWV